MTDRPTDAGSFAEGLYEVLEPVTREDAANLWSLLIYLGGAGQLVQEIQDYSRDTDAGPGWSILVDLDRAPLKALPWLGQFVGVKLDTSLAEVDQRNLIRGTPNWKRGTTQAMIDAALHTLTGDNPPVIFRERNGGSAWQLHVVTFTANTPNPAKTEDALRSQKPGGIVLTYETLDGQDYELLFTNFATYQDIFATYSTYQAIIEDRP